MECGVDGGGGRGFGVEELGEVFRQTGGVRAEGGGRDGDGMGGEEAEEAEGEEGVGGEGGEDGGEEAG